MIMAAGIGERFSNEVPKQFVTVGKHPIVIHTLLKFRNLLPDSHICLIVHSNHGIYWQEIEKQYSWLMNIRKIEGGNTRFQSVKNGLQAITDESIVAIHDGVRPFLSTELINKCFELAVTHKAVVPVVNVNDTLRLVQNQHSETVSRDNYKLVQTPQVFHTQILKKAYATDYSGETDDASVVQKAGYLLYFAQGEPYNIKITQAADLILAKALLTETY